MSAKQKTTSWGFLSVMRFLERRAGTKPRIGQNRRRADDIADMGQDPYLGFVGNDLSEVDLAATPPRVRPRFLGFFGPFGPLPNSTTREVEFWAKNGDTAFVRFADIFVARFQQLFYRSWSDARAITQYDHPSRGTFPRHLRALTGDAHTSYDGRAAVDDIIRLRYTALQRARVKSPVRLRQMLATHFGLSIRVEEFVSDWLDFAPEDQSVMGIRGMGLGRDLRMGRRTASIGEKITIHVECPDHHAYESFLPGQTRYGEMADLILGYLGPFTAVDVALWLPEPVVRPVQLGGQSQLGWTSALPFDSAHVAQGPLVQAAKFRMSNDQILMH